MRGHLTPLTPVATFFTAVSLSWTGYSVTDLIHSGTWGLLAAVSVDGLWAVVQYLEYKGIGGRTTKALGWAALAGACTLLGYHAWSINWGAVIASVLPPVVAKIAWIGDIRLRHNPAALTPEEVAALARMERGMVFEEREHDIRMRQQRMRAELLVSEVSTDFDIEVMRQDRARDLQRRAPLALPAAAPAPFDRVAEQSIEAVGEHDREHGPSTTNTIASNPNTIREQLANNAVTSPNADREQPSIADLVREQIANTTDNATAVRNVLAARPDANKESVAASVRRERKKAGPYL